MNTYQLITVKKSLAVILVLASLGSAVAWMIEGEVSPHQGDRDTVITIDYDINNTVTDDARVKVYLNAYDPIDNGFDYNIDKTLIEYFEVEPDNLSPIRIELTNTVSGLYRICLRLAHNSSYYRDCDKANQFLLIDDTPIWIQGLQEESPELKLVVESPSQVLVNEGFEVNVTIVNEGSGVFDGRLYSYVSNGTKVSVGSYSGNQESLFLSPGAETLIRLDNEVFSRGNHSLVVKAVGGEKYEVRRGITVLEPEGKRFLSRLRFINDELRIVASNTGSVNKSVLIKLYSLNYSFSQEAGLDPRRSYEVFINSSLLSGRVYVFLFENGLLVDEESILTPSDNGTPFVFNNESPVQNGTRVITGSFVVPDGSGETLLYPVIVISSLVMVLLLLWKT
ncbi:hypothetical protein GF352_01525 [archaeon]|nr:hypothetical protein [archaeon]